MFSPIHRIVPKKSLIQFSYFDVSLTVHHSINLFLSPTWCTFASFCNICIALDASTCSSNSMLIFRRSKLYFTAFGIVTRPCSTQVESTLQSALNRCTARASNVIHILQNKANVHQVGNKNKFCCCYSIFRIIVVNISYSPPLPLFVRRRFLLFYSLGDLMPICWMLT
jgi:hypothetical protein